MPTSSLKCISCVRNILIQSRPVHCLTSGDDCDSDKFERHKNSQCTRIMLEAGADLLLEANHGDGSYINAFIAAVGERSHVNTPIHRQL